MRKEKNSNDKKLINAKSPPIDITTSPQEHLVQLVNLTAGEKETVSAAKAKQHLQNDKLIKKIIHALRGLHTHNIKIPNTNRAGQIYFPPPTDVKPAPYIYSQTIKAGKNFGWAANAAESKAKLFFTTEFIYQNETTCLFQEFQKDSSDLINLLFQLGLLKQHAKQMQEACQNVVSHPLPDHAEDPQILWPLDDSCENYYAITPVPHIATLREIYQRTQITKEDEHWFKTSNMLIGGTQPINAGDFVSSLAGWVRLLRSELPFRDKDSEFSQLSRKVGKLKTILNLSALRDSDFDYMAVYHEIDSVVSKHKKTEWRTLKHNRTINNELNKLLAILFEDALLLRHGSLIEGEILPLWVQKALPPIEIKYITQARLSKIDEEKFVGNIMEKLSPKIEKAMRRDEKRRNSSHLKTLLKEALADYLLSTYE